MASDSVPSQGTAHSAQWVVRDEEHLRLLAGYHGVVALGLVLFCLFLYVLPLAVGPGYYQLFSVLKPLPPQWLLAGLLVSLIQVTVLGLNGWCLWRRKNRWSSLVLSCAECLCLPPLGFLLGVSAVLVLRRDSVAARFTGATSSKSIQGAE